MHNRVKYFVFNKTVDFTKGYLHNMIYKSGKLTLKEKSLLTKNEDENQSLDYGIFFTKVLDKKESLEGWHRILVNSEDLGDASIRFKFYSSELPYINTGEGYRDIKEFFEDEKIDYVQKEKYIKPYLVKTSLSPKDILIHEAKGRYMWMTIEFFGQTGKSPIIHDMKIYLERENWMNYLPEIFLQDGNDFLERFLYIFQTMNEDLEYKINNISNYFNPDTAEGEFLWFLSDWIAIDDGYVWDDEKLRYLIKNAMRLYKIRGTRRYIKEIVKLYLGVEPIILENYDIKNGIDNAQIANLSEKLYGDNPYCFHILVSEDDVPTTKKYKTLLSIVENAKPAFMDVNVVVLKPYLFLDNYVYLGVNAHLEHLREASLDGLSAISFTTLAEDDTYKEE